MRVLLVTPFFAPAWRYGGVARATSELTLALRRLGHEVVVMTCRWDERHPGCEEQEGLRVWRLPSSRWLRERLFPFSPQLARLVRQEHRRQPFDVAHIACHRNGLAFAAGRVLRRLGVPWVLQPHGTYPHHGARRLLKWGVDRVFAESLVAGAAHVIAVSRAEAADLPRAAVVIPNGVSRVGQADGVVATGEGNLLFVGNDSIQKRGRSLCSLLAMLPKTRLEMVGSYGKEFRAGLAAQGDRVRWLGVLDGDSLACAYARSDLLVQPSRGEAFGLAPFEAALYGTAAVVIGDHGCGEWFGEAGGCVVPTLEDLPAAVATRLAAANLRQGEAQRVAAFATQNLSWDGVVTDFVRVYRAPGKGVSTLDRGRAS